MEAADGVDVRAGPASVVVIVARVRQADVAEAAARRDLAREIQARRAALGNADLIPGPEIVADLHLGFLHIAADLEDIDVLALPVIDVRVKHHGEDAFEPQAEVSRAVVRVVRVGDAQGNQRVLVCSNGGPGVAGLKVDHPVGKGGEGHRDRVSFPVPEGVVAAVNIAVLFTTAGRRRGRRCRRRFGLVGEGAGVQAADRVDVRAGPAPAGVCAGVRQADIAEAAARRDLAGNVQPRGTAFGDTDLIPGAQVVADLYFGFLHIAADLKDVDVVSRPVIDGRGEAQHQNAVDAQAEVAGAAVRVTGVRKTDGDLRVGVGFSFAAPGVAVGEFHHVGREGAHRHRDRVALPVGEGVVVAVPIALLGKDCGGEHQQHRQGQRQGEKLLHRDTSFFKSAGCL